MAPGSDAVAAQIRQLEESLPLREPLLRAVIRALELPAASRGLDIGCGTGHATLWLAQAVGNGSVTGLDITPDVLRHAAAVVAASGAAERVAFRAGDMRRLPFADRSFDWIWSADCVGYPVGDTLPVLREIARVLRPGGTVAILAWSAQQLLPGFPLLEARLNATCSAYAPWLAGQPAEAHFARLPAALAAAGFAEPVGRTFAADVQAPLGPELRRALASLFAMLWGTPQPGASPDDLAELERLCRPTSPDCILNLPGYHAFFTYTLYRARLPR